MARISRKSGNIKEGEWDGRYPAAGYVRLSDREQGTDVSESVKSQCEMVRSYVEEQKELYLTEIYVDDGKSGTNFERPAFQKMMNQVRNGKLRCIVVKDLSRFGRNYLETGNYIEHLFPLFKVRLIALTDHFDTSTASKAELSYLFPLKNLMNESYAKDISRKERSAKKIMRSQGLFLGSSAPYGYRKKEGDGHRLEIDEEAAGIVRLIYQMQEEGSSDYRIAAYLNRQHIPSPSAYKYKKGILHAQKYRDPIPWYRQTVARIASSEVYLGILVQGMRASVQVRGKKEVMPSEKWDRVEHMHEPVVTEEQFYRVQQMRAARCRGKEAEEKNERQGIMGSPPVSGRVYCRACGRAMVRRMRGKHTVYTCSFYENTGLCSRNPVTEEALLSALKAAATAALMMEGYEEKWLGRRYLAKQDREEKRQMNQKQDGECRGVAEKAVLYEAFKAGRISWEEYEDKKHAAAEVKESIGMVSENMEKEVDTFLQKFVEKCIIRVEIGNEKRFRMQLVRLPVREEDP